MPTSERGEFGNPKKSAYSFEYYDSLWELELMKDLENDPKVAKWTKNHSIIIPYWDEDGKLRGFKPDFLVEKTDGTKEIIEIKGKHLLALSKRKMEAAREWCKTRKMEFSVISKY